MKLDTDLPVTIAGFRQAYLQGMTNPVEVVALYLIVCAVRMAARPGFTFVPRTRCVPTRWRRTPRYAHRGRLRISHMRFRQLCAEIPAPLGIGTLTLGREVKGFLCESIAVTGATEVSASGGWRAYMTSVPNPISEA